MREGRPTLVHRIRIRAPIEAVWKAITDPAYTRQYLFGLSVRSEWTRGVRIVYETQDGAVYMEGTLLDASAPHRLSYSLRVLRDADTAADLPSRVTWELRPVEDGCELTVVHDEFDGETPTYRAVSGGWPVALEGLRELLERGGATSSQARWPAHIRRPKE